MVTLPYPGFPTDLQPFAMTLAAVSDGTAMITENVFESRFMFAQELARLGADLRTDGHHAVVRGQPMLSGAPVVAHDIRAGRGAGARRAGRAGHHDGRATRSTSTAATPTSWRCSTGSARTSRGSTYPTWSVRRPTGPAQQQHGHRKMHFPPSVR